MNKEKACASKKNTHLHGMRDALLHGLLQRVAFQENLRESHEQSVRSLMVPHAETRLVLYSEAHLCEAVEVRVTPVGLLFFVTDLRRDGVSTRWWISSAKACVFFYGSGCEERRQDEKKKGAQEKLQHAHVEPSHARVARVPIRRWWCARAPRRR